MSTGALPIVWMVILWSQLQLPASEGCLPRARPKNSLVLWSTHRFLYTLTGYLIREADQEPDDRSWSVEHTSLSLYTYGVPVSPDSGS
jgi:hypothetical protein